MKKKIRIALAGNPNCGKTSIFNALTGARQHVGNYPGVTVESKSGNFSIGDFEIELIDLPGVYSLSSSSPEEKVVFEELTKKGIDLILNVINSSIPRRNLYLTTQLAELHIPMMLVFNMSDDAEKKGIKFDIPKLEKYFGSPIARSIGRKTSGIKEVVEKLAKTLANLENHGVPMLSYGNDIDDSISAIAKKIDALGWKKYSHIPSRFFAIKLLESDSCTMKIPEFQDVWKEVAEQIKHLSAIHAIDDTSTFMADRRYAMLSGACRDSMSITGERRRQISDKIDNVMTNKWIGLPIFFFIIYITFWFTFTCAQPFMDWIEAGFGWLSEYVKSNWDAGTLPYMRDLLTDGIIGGIGGVIVFLPNILFLFFAIATLEDSGYMARAAFVMDGIMRKFGLQGRSFVPLILGFGCSVPAIMATRTIESERDRKTTIMVLPLMSCGARLPIYALIIPAFFALKYQALMMWIIYLIGVIVALIAARILKNTVFKGEGEVYLMELPPYRMPTLRSLMLHMWDRGKMYLQKAGTIILATSILLYIANTYPEKENFSKNYDTQIEQAQNDGAIGAEQLKLLSSDNLLNDEEIASIKSEGAISDEMIESIGERKMNDAQKTILEKAKSANEALAKLENEKAAEAMEYTLSGRVGKFLEPVFSPIGFDWKMTTASIGALAAKEVFVSQLGILYAEGEADKESVPLREQLATNYTPLQGFCMMLFCLLSIPCLATLAVIKRELNSWKAAGVEMVGLFALAYIMTLMVYQIGSLLGIGTKLIS
jgi:ferrous iron transport protein B